MIELQAPRWLLWCTDRRFVYKKLLVECLIARDGDQCFYCHVSLEKTSLQHKTIDHIVPLSRGGRTTFGNVVLACWWCNHMKADRRRDQFERSIELRRRRGSVLQAKMAAWKRQQGNAA